MVVTLPRVWLHVRFKVLRFTLDVRVVGLAFIVGIYIIHDPEVLHQLNI